MADESFPVGPNPCDMCGGEYGQHGGECKQSVNRSDALLPVMHNPTHREPFARFVQAMADELRANAHKGDRAGWLTMNQREAVGEVLYHAAKLAYAASKHVRGEADAGDVLEFAADVANCALMVADVCGVLTVHEQIAK